MDEIEDSQARGKVGFGREDYHHQKFTVPNELVVGQFTSEDDSRYFQDRGADRSGCWTMKATRAKFRKVAVDPSKSGGNFAAASKSRKNNNLRLHSCGFRLEKTSPKVRPKSGSLERPHYLHLRDHSLLVDDDVPVFLLITLAMNMPEVPECFG